MATRRKRPPEKDKDVTRQAFGMPFQATKQGVVGTPSDTERAGTRGTYAASSVIERGTAAAMKVELAAEDDEQHYCLCGCGQKPSQADSLFMPGHDSKVRAMGKAIMEGRLKIDEVYAPAVEYLERGGMLKAS